MCLIVEIRNEDLAKIRGISYSRASVLMKKIKKDLGKQKHQLVTPDEVANYYGIPVRLVIEKVNEKPQKSS